MVLADRTGAGFEDLKDGVIGVLLFLLIHSTILPTGIVRILRGHAIAILRLAGIQCQKISSAVLALAWGVAVPHSIKQVICKEIHIAFKCNRIQENQLVLIPWITAKGKFGK